MNQRPHQPCEFSSSKTWDDGDDVIFGVWDHSRSGVVRARSDERKNLISVRLKRLCRGSKLAARLKGYQTQPVLALRRRDINLDVITRQLRNMGKRPVDLRAAVTRT